MTTESLVLWLTFPQEGKESSPGRLVSHQDAQTHSLGLARTLFKPV